MQNFGKAINIRKSMGVLFVRSEKLYVYILSLSARLIKRSLKIARK